MCTIPTRLTSLTPASVVSMSAVLFSRIESSKDIKESQDLANSLQAQSLKMQAIKMQYDVWESKNKADAEMLKTQQKAEFKQQQLQAAVPDFQ